MSYDFYKVLHFVGLFMVFSSLGAACLLAMKAGSRNFPERKFIGMMHGLGLGIAIIAGFGLMAKLQLMSAWPGWIHGKLVVWFVLGGAPTLIYKKPRLGKVWWGTLILVGGVAAYLARYKPF